jgi:hypothetical protein
VQKIINECSYLCGFLVNFVKLISNGICDFVFKCNVYIVVVKEIPEATKIESALKAPSQKGAAQYTQWVSKLWRETAKLKLPDARRFLNSCRAHLEVCHVTDFL